MTLHPKKNKSKCLNTVLFKFMSLVSKEMAYHHEVVIK